MKTIDTSRILEGYRSQDDYTEDTLEKAEQALTDARMQLSGGASQLATMILDVCYQVWTTAIDTLAVTLAADGVPILLINPNFAVALTETPAPNMAPSGGSTTMKSDPSGLVFVLAHEAYHLCFKHLRRDEELSGQNGLMATEATNNFFVANWLNKSGVSGAWRTAGTAGRWMPTVPKLKKDGTPARTSSGAEARERTGVDPWKVHDEYRTNLLDNGLTPAPLDMMYSSDAECLRQLNRMVHPPKPPTIACLHMQSDEQGGADGGGQNCQQQTGGQPTDTVTITLDQEATDTIVGERLREAIARGMREGEGKKIAKELLNLADATPEANKLWGDLGLGALRGQTVRTRRVDYWAQWLGNQMATRLMESDRLVYDRSIVWETRLSYCGDDEKFNILIAVDTSGSMDQRVLNKIAELVGHSDQFDATWIAFDGQVWPFKPGDTMQGGGGTNFDIIEQFMYSDQLDEEPDAVIVVTDGYAPHLTPRQPDKWIWLITDGGDCWPSTHNPAMSCHEMMLD